MKTIKAQIIQTKAQANISNGQWTQAIILDKFIKITKGAKTRAVFLYQAKNNAKRKAKETAAWSEGKDASGIWSIISLQSIGQNHSGLSKWKNLWKIKFDKTANKVV